MTLVQRRAVAISTAAASAGPPVGVNPGRADRSAQLQSQIAYHRQRLALHQRLHGTAPSARLRGLEDAYQGARDRLGDTAASADA